MWHTRRGTRAAALVAAALVATVAAPASATPDGSVALAPTVANAAATPVAVTAPASAPKGAKVRIYVKAPNSVDAAPYIESSADGTTWTRTSTKVVMIDGYGTAKWTPSGTRTYRIRGDGIASDPFAIAVKAVAGAAITAGASTFQARWGEMVWLESYAVSGGKAPGEVKVAYEKASTKTGTFSRIGTVTSRASGYSGFRIRPTVDAYYRAVVLGAGGAVVATSEPFLVDMIAGDTTLEERRSSLSWALGASTGSIKAVPTAAVKKAKYTGGATSARYQTFEGGTLIEVRRPGKIRTWLVYSRFLAEYTKQKKWNGPLGLPERDVLCGLPEGGCVQLFSGGAVYTNTSKMSPGRYVALGRTIQVEILAAARSQLNYKEDSWRVSKYNAWIDGTNAWCQVFVAWAAYASGHAGDVPKKTYFPTYLATVKKSPALIRNPKASQIRAGDVLIFDWGTGKPSHTGFAVKVSGRYVYTVEGNTTDGTGADTRGVFYRKRPLGGVWGMFHPSDY